MLHPHDQRQPRPESGIAGTDRRNGAAPREGGGGRRPGAAAQAARGRQTDGPRTPGRAAGHGQLSGIRHLRGARRQPADAGRGSPRRGRGDRQRHHPRAAGVRVQSGLHGAGRQSGQDARRQGRQDHGPGRQDRLPHHRAERQRRGADSGGRGQPERLRRDFLPQCRVLRGGAADFGHPGAVRGRRGVQPGADRLHPDEPG